MSGSTLALRYAGFAVLAMLANLGAQRLVLAGSADVAAVPSVLALGTGTLAGLVVKYLLDKRWIFYDRSAGVHAHSTRFALYSVMGIATTALFWITETLFWLLGGTQLARELGAILGLTIGYLVKYQLDRRFVFDAETVAT